MRKLVGAIFLILTAAAPGSANIVGPWITLLPGAISGHPGDTEGWGFTIEADPVYWISFTDSETAGESSFLGSGGATGYSDLLGAIGGPDGGALRPDPGQSNPWIVAFDDLTGQGLGEYAIDPGVPIGSEDTGSLIIHYLVFDGDPSAGGNQVGGTQQLFLPNDPSPGSAAPSFEVDVVPEPATNWLVGVSLLALGAAFRRRQK